eukprot:CCRYP_003031-RA/>CCRYP_003031-RA protein AED:0.70 eAED:0.79 QI:0/0/0/1/0/0/2/0/94
MISVPTTILIPPSLSGKRANGRISNERLASDEDASPRCYLLLHKPVLLPFFFTIINDFTHLVVLRGDSDPKLNLSLICTNNRITADLHEALQHN